MAPTTVFVARRVITMDPTVPDATAVAVTDGRVSAVGALDDLRAAGEVDKTFADAVLLPGLIDWRWFPAQRNG